MSPIQLTTSLEPRTAAAIIHAGGVNIAEVDDQASATVDEHVRRLAVLLSDHWGLANLARRHQSQRNRERTSANAVPNISTGDHVLYAVHKPDTKLDYTWRGPGVVVGMPNQLICTVQPCTAHPSKPFDDTLPGCAVSRAHCST
jgi:hypothetical protein